MRRRWQALIALPPAFLLCAMSLLTLALPTIESPLCALAAFLGTVGLTWAILGVEAGQRWIVVTLLGVGISAVAWRLAFRVIDSLSEVRWASPFHPSKILWLLLSAWLVLGPLTVGVFQIVRLIREAVRSPNTSLERTRER
jgi:hypothetical protein